MLDFIARRLVAIIPVLAVVAIFVFLMLRLTPGDPAAVIAGDNATSDQIADIRAKLASGRSFAYLKRSLTPRQEYLVNNLGIPGIEFSAAERRIYPLGDLASHSVGYCNIDNNGQAGIERGLNPSIRGANGPIALALDAHDDLLVVELDVTSPDAAQEAVRATLDRFGRIDVLVNNAGATRGGNFFELPDDAFVDGFALKYFAAVRLSRLFWPLLKAAHGSIINIIGAAARTPVPPIRTCEKPFIERKITTVLHMPASITPIAMPINASVDASVNASVDTSVGAGVTPGAPAK